MSSRVSGPPVGSSSETVLESEISARGGLAGVKPSVGPGEEPSEIPVRDQVLSILSALYPEADRPERRREERFPYPQLVRITPLADDGESLLPETLIATGKHLSTSGLGFYHRQPLPHRRVVATLESGENDSFSLLLDIRWCRFNSRGWYESGGRFLRSWSGKVERKGQRVES